MKYVLIAVFSVSLLGCAGFQVPKAELEAKISSIEATVKKIDDVATAVAVAVKDTPLEEKLKPALDKIELATNEVKKEIVVVKEEVKKTPAESYGWLDILLLALGAGAGYFGVKYPILRWIPKIISIFTTKTQSANTKKKL